MDTADHPKRGRALAGRLIQTLCSNTMNDRIENKHTFKAPLKDKEDYLHGGLRAILAVIPAIGPLAVEVFSTVFDAPISKRRARWMQEIADGLTKLESKYDDLKLENLSTNEMFISVALKATQSAIRNHQKEKLKLLRNAVLNSALPDAPDDDVQELFLQLIDSMTLSHILILALFNDPNEYYERLGNKLNRNTSSNDILKAVLPDLDRNKQLYELFVKDLHAKGLIKTADLKINPTIVARFASHTTNLGIQFIKYVSDPLKSRDN